MSRKGRGAPVAPVGTPRAAIDALNRVMTAYLVRPAAAEKLARFIISERAKWAEVAATAGIEPQ